MTRDEKLADDKGKRGGKVDKDTRTQELERARIAGRTEIWLKAIPWIGLIVVLGVLYFPLMAIQPMVEDLAGKRTNISATFTISIAINVILGGAYFAQRRKSAAQTKELIRLRSRLEEIDAQRAIKREG